MSEPNRGAPAWLGGIGFLVLVGLVVAGTRIRIPVDDVQLDAAVAQAGSTAILPCAQGTIAALDVIGGRSLIGEEIRGTAQLVDSTAPACATPVRFVATREAGPLRHGRSRPGRYTVISLAPDR
ncbi:MAG: hypothetical protein AAFV53_09010 [Myxococcota bacterium]